MRMRKKRWLIPLLVLFIGIILPTKAHAMELKDTDESVVKWDTAKISSHTNQSGDLWCDYNLEQEKYSSYKDAVENISRYAVDLVDDRKGDRFHAYIPFTISTDKENLDDLSTDVLAQVKQWMMFGNDVTKHEILSFSYSRSGGYENLRRFEVYVEDVKQAGSGFEGKLDILAVYSNTQDFFQKYETGVQNAVKDMDVDGKSDYDKAYAVCKWIQRKIKYEPGKYDQSGMYAMVNKEAVCNGKAELACYIGRCVGIDTLYVGGNSDDDHAWNLMKIDGEWYYVDPTTGPDSATFLQGTDYIQTSFREVKYKDEDGPSDDEISPYSYNVMHSSCNGEHEWVKSFTRNPGCTKKGYDVYKCKKCKNSKFINFVEPLVQNQKFQNLFVQDMMMILVIQILVMEHILTQKKKKPLPLSDMTGKTMVTEQLPARETAVERPIRISGRKLERLLLPVQIQEKQNILVPSAVRQRPRQSKRWDINMRLSVPMMQPVLSQKLSIKSVPAVMTKKMRLPVKH